MEIHQSQLNFGFGSILGYVQLTLYLQMNIYLLDLQSITRRDAGVVERGGLENRCPLTGTEGSNPSLSARAFAEKPAFLRVFYLEAVAPSKACFCKRLLLLNN